MQRRRYVCIYLPLHIISGLTVHTGHRGTTSCISCARRNETCHFSPLRKPRRGLATPTTSSPAVSEDRIEGCHEMSKYDGLQVLYLDQLLASPRPGSSRKIPGESLQVSSAVKLAFSLPMLIDDLGTKCLRRRIQSDIFFRGASDGA